MSSVDQNHQQTNKYKMYYQWGVDKANQSRQSALGEIEQHHPYPTEYSQVSAIETGFKKLKSNQIQILKQLKKQYQVLRNTHIDSQILKKGISDSESNGGSSVIVSQVPSSGRSRRVSQHKQYRTAALQKKQMEMMLNNSMRKIQQLLHSELQLKKTVLQLRDKLQNTKGSQNQYEQIIKNHKQQKNTINQTLQLTKQQVIFLKNNIRQITIHNASLQGQKVALGIQLKKKQERIRLLEEQLLIQKNKYLNIQLDLKKIKNQYDLSMKTSKQQAQILEKRIRVADERIIQQKQAQILKLNRQLSIQQQRYHNLNKIKHNNQLVNNQQPDYVKVFQKIITHLSESRNKSQSNADLILALKSFTQNTQRQNRGQFAQQVANLKKQITNLKSGRQSQVQYSRVRQLQRIIQQQNIQKAYLMEDIQKVQRQLNSLRNQKQQALLNLQKYNITIQNLTQQNKRLKNQVQSIRAATYELTQSQHQNKALVTKLQQLSLKESQTIQLKQQLAEVNQIIKNTSSEAEDQIRLLKRQIAEEQIKSYRIKQQSQLKFTLMKTQLQSQITRNQQLLQKQKRNTAIQRSQWVSQKAQLETRLLQKNKQIQNLKIIIQNIKTQHQKYIQNIRVQNRNLVKDIDQKHVRQLSMLTSKLQNLTNITQKQSILINKNIVLQQQLLETRRILKANKFINEAVDHLWQVKQVQYSNIHDILKISK